MLRAVDIAPGIHNYVVNWAGVRRGEEVVVLADGMSADELVVESVASVASAQGAHVNVVWIPYNPIPVQGAGKSVSYALMQADKVFRLCWAVSHDKSSAYSYQMYGTSFFGCARPQRDFFASRAATFPIELTFAIARRQIERIWEFGRGHVVRVVHPNGTDLRAYGDPEDWVVDGVKPLSRRRGWLEPKDIPGAYPNNFPGIVVGLVPPHGGQGMVKYESFAGIGATPDMTLTFDEGRAIQIRGGVEAARLRELIQGVPGGNTMVEIMWGLHPKIRADAPIDQVPIPTEAERFAGNLHVAIGNRPWFGHVMRLEQSRVQRHLDGFMRKPSVYIDDEPIIENGYPLVLQDAEVRKVAAKYGDPDELLMPTGLTQAVEDKGD